MARFFRRGVSEVHFLPAVADTDAPTRAEIDAGTPLGVDVAEISGFQLSNDPIPTPDLDTDFTSQISGEDTVESSTLTFYDQDDSETIRTALAKGTTGFIMLMPYGDDATKRGEVWPVKTTGVNDEYTVANEAARFVVGFAVTAVPDQDSSIPAAA